MIAASLTATETGLEEGRLQAEDHTVNDEVIYWLSRETDYHVTIIMTRKSSFS